MLKLKNFSVKRRKKKIINNINLSFEKGKSYVLMGPNGSGKTTLVLAILGHPELKINKNSKIYFQGKDISNLKTEKRVKRGIFLSFQFPVSLGEINIYQLLSYAFPYTNPLKIKKKVEKAAKEIGVKKDLLERSFFPGLSGGEKKKIELLQVLIFNPKLVIFDEIDAGLDIDALKKIIKVLNKIQKNKTFIFITHNPSILKYLKVDYLLIMKKGEIVKKGKKDLIQKIEKEGYKKF